MDDFELLKVLGTGAYGKVFLVRKLGGSDGGKLYAMKVLKKASIVQKSKTTEHTRTERQVLEAIRRSPFLVKLHYAFQTDAKLHLILDYISGGELFTHLYLRERFREDEVRFYIGEIVLALEALHKLEVIYRDIKLENILLDADGHVVLTDFGLSKEFSPHEKVRRTYSYCGTVEYMAPEIVRGSSGTGHDFSVDWWSLGVLTFELLTGASPFAVDGVRNTQSEISRRILSEDPPMPASFSSPLKDFVKRLLAKDPKSRLGANGADEVKAHSFFKGMNWEMLACKKVPPPFKPSIKSELDTSNFSEEFTMMAPEDSPAAPPPSSVERMFKGYSYVAPSVVFSRNADGEDLILQPSSVRDELNLSLASKLKDSLFFQIYDLDMSAEGFLGDGSFSVCRRCIHKRTGKPFAAKIVNRRVEVAQEVAALKACRGQEGIVQLYDVLHDELHTYLIMELLHGGELLDRIRLKDHFTEAEASRIMAQLVNAVDFLHGAGIVHRDLKPENILFKDENVDETLRVKIIDFGFARMKAGDCQLLRTPCFTVGYAAPEVLKMVLTADDGYDEACDLWSLGVILYTMLSGKVPFQATSNGEKVSAIMERIKGGHFSVSGPEWDVVTDAAKKVIQGLLTVDPQQRMTMNSLRGCDWLRHANGGGSRTGFAVSGAVGGFAGGAGALDSATPLMTPDILSSSGSSALQLQIHTTMKALSRAARQGFRLHDVSSAPLAQRRRNKQSSTASRSSSSESTTAAAAAATSGAASASGGGASPSKSSPSRSSCSSSSGRGAGGHGSKSPSPLAKASVARSPPRPLACDASGGFQPLRTFSGRPPASGHDASDYFSFKDAAVSGLPLPDASPLVVTVKPRRRGGPAEQQPPPLRGKKRKADKAAVDAAAAASSAEQPLSENGTFHYGKHSCVSEVLADRS